MLGLRLRPEFAAKHLKGTTIQLITDGLALLETFVPYLEIKPL
jgi:hypothetical protein